jgi:hypothetical protein
MPNVWMLGVATLLFFGQTFFSKKKKNAKSEGWVVMELCNCGMLLFLVRLFFKEEKNAMSEGVVNWGS